MDKIINKIHIEKIWGRLDLNWENLNRDVNILIGINGSGKTTFFNILDAILAGDLKRFKNYGVNAKLNIGDEELCFNQQLTNAKFKQLIKNIKYRKISTFDVPVKDKRKLGQNESPLLNELKSVIYEIGQDTLSFSDYRLKATNFPDQAEQINHNIQEFYQTVNDLFARTQKTIEIDPYSNRLVFRKGKELIQIEQLSSGEKQLLLILLKVFLMEEKPYILLMDEPEISLHIEWQYKLIQEIRKLNPNCQIITSTHSPSLFGDGWSDKLIYIEDITQKHENA